MQYINIPAGTTYPLILGEDILAMNTSKIYLQCDTVGAGAINILLPKITIPSGGSIKNWFLEIFINDIGNNASGNNIKITPAPSDTINGSASQIILSTNGATGRIVITGKTAWDFNIGSDSSGGGGIPFGNDVSPTADVFQTYIPNATLTDGYVFEMRVANNNTGALPFLQINGLGFFPVIGTDLNVPLTANSFVTDLIYLFTFNALGVYECLGFARNAGGGDIMDNAVFVDAVWGDDSTGQPSNFTKKYKTIQAGITSAVANGIELIYVMAGNYTENTNLIGRSYYFSPNTNMTGVVIDSSGNGGFGVIACKVYGYGNFFGTTSIINLNSAGNIYFECNKLEQIAGGSPDAPIKTKGNDVLEVSCNYMKTTATGACMRIEGSGNSKSFITVKEEMIGRALESNFGSGSVPYLKLVSNRITNNYGIASPFSGTIATIARGDINIYCNDIRDNSVYPATGLDKYCGSIFYRGGGAPFLCSAKIYGNMISDNVAGIWVNAGTLGTSFEWHGDITAPNSCVFLSFNDGAGATDNKYKFNGYFKGTKPPTATVGGIGAFELKSVGVMKIFIDGVVENLLPDLAGISKSNDPAIDVILGVIKILTTVSVGTAPALSSVTLADTYKTAQICARQQPNINMTNSIVGSVDYADATIE
jgi:hypothetical protein